MPSSASRGAGRRPSALVNVSARGILVSASRRCSCTRMPAAGVPCAVSRTWVVSLPGMLCPCDDGADVARGFVRVDEDVIGEFEPKWLEVERHAMFIGHLQVNRPN